MKKYQILWHDYEDGGNGNPIFVEAETPKEAYNKAIGQIQSFAKMFQASDLECLIDEKGKYYHPDFLDK